MNQEMRNQFLLRQADIIEQKLLDARVTIIGAGAIGSFTALALTKMGMRSVTVMDDDTISQVNMNSQFYPLGAIGEKKVNVLTELTELFSGNPIRGIDEKFQGPSAESEFRGPFPGIVISAVDNMATRRLVYEVHKNTQTPWLIDPRMAAEYATMYVINPADPKDQETYEKSLFTDDEAVQERCTAKSTIYTVLLIAGHVCKAVKDIVTNNKYPRYTDWAIKENCQTVYFKETANDTH